MLMELTIIPLAREGSISRYIAGIVKFLDESGLDYRMTAFGTLVEGSWDQLMEVAKKCHFQMRSEAKRVLTLIRIDDSGDRAGEIDGGVGRVERHLGRPIPK